MSQLIDRASGSCTCQPPFWEQTKNVLEEEANVLAGWLEDTKTQSRPPRVEIAVLREIRRLRDLGSGLELNIKERPQ